VFDGGAKRRCRKISEKASIRRPAAQVDEDSESDSDVSCNYEVIDRCDNSRFAKYWSLSGSKFLDTADNINFNITAVCKCDGAYYFRYVREHVKHAKMPDFEYIHRFQSCSTLIGIVPSITHLMMATMRHRVRVRKLANVSDKEFLVNVLLL
jgi:hypothetical protein